jgi:ECF sigma factor
MNEVSRIRDAIEHGDLHAAANLLPLVYNELRRPAAQHLVQEARG